MKRDPGNASRPSLARAHAALLLCVLGAFWPCQVLFADDSGQDDGDPLERFVYPPELVMKHQSAIGLRSEQRQGLVSEVTQLQTDIVPLQFELSEAAESLVKVLAAPRVDEAAAVAEVERITSLEAQIKKRHLVLLIRIKNLLSGDQQAQLDALR